MPNGHDYSKKYGPHDYGSERDGRQNCRHFCGCWASVSMSGGPLGLDPFGGECPGNPEDGKLVGGNADYEIVVTRRIRQLESNLYRAVEELKKLNVIRKTPKKQMAERIEGLEEELEKKTDLLKALSEAINKVL